MKTLTAVQHQQRFRCIQNIRPGDMVELYVDKENRPVAYVSPRTVSFSALESLDGQVRIYTHHSSHRPESSWIRIKSITKLVKS